MKKIMAILLALLVLAGCSSKPAESNVQDSSTPQQTESVDNQEGNGEVSEEAELTADKDFIADFAKAMCARWDFSETIEFEAGTKSHQEAYLGLVKAEEDVVGKYAERKFSDPKLADLCRRYLAGIENQKIILGIMLTDYMSYYNSWLSYQGDRAVVLRDMADNYGVSFDEKYADAYYALYNKGYTHLHHQEMLEMLNEERNAGNFSMGNGVYTTQATNKTDNTFVNFNVYIYLYDGNGDYLDYGTCFIPKWEPGQKIDLSFNYEVADKYISSAEISED